MLLKKTLVFLMLILIACTCFACKCEHNWSTANCTTPQKCILCGITEGTPLGHNWVYATCTAPKTCSTCGSTEGVPLDHRWNEATCTTPKSCRMCGYIAQDAIGHTWKEATCTEPSICLNCGKTAGNPTGHTVEDWILEKESTCAERGLESGNCIICNEIIEHDIPRKEHTPGDWEITEKATEYSEGTRTLYCSVCGNAYRTETYSLSSHELETIYISKCKIIPYDDLARYPSKYDGEYVKFYGKVVQVCSEATSSLYYSTYRVATSGNYNNVVYIYVDNYNSGHRILEDDWITFYGQFDGLYTYTTVMGASITIPSIKVEYIS